MNHLAHAYLSFHHPEILIGNLVSDFMKGGVNLGLSGNIQLGVQLHHAIDSYTDQHPVTLRARKFFASTYRLYSAPIIDVIYDHYLANNPSCFKPGELENFSASVYSTLEQGAAHLPPKFLKVLYYMKAQDWLVGYRSEEGIRKSLQGLGRRASYMTDPEEAYKIFLRHYDELGNCFREFFPDLKLFSKQLFEELVLKSAKP